MTPLQILMRMGPHYRPPGPCRRQWYGVHQIHLIVVMFAFAYLAQTVAVGCEFVHLYVYSGDGRGLRLRHTWLALDFMAAERCPCGDSLFGDPAGVGGKPRPHAAYTGWVSSVCDVCTPLGLCVACMRGQV